MANLYRATNLIKPLTAARAALPDEVVWAVRLRKFLEGHGGRMPLHQRPHNDPKGQPSLYLSGRPMRRAMTTRLVAHAAAGLWTGWNVEHEHTHIRSP